MSDIRVTKSQFERLIVEYNKKNVKTMNEARDYPVRRTTGPGEHEKFQKYGHGTKWWPASKKDPKSKSIYDTYVEKYGPFTLYISGDDSIKIACQGDRCWDQRDYNVSREEAAQMLGVQSLDDIDEHGVISYEAEDDRPMFETDQEIDEIFGSKWDKPEKAAAAFEKHWGKQEKRPKWSTPGEAGYENALEAAKQHKTADIYYHPHKKQYLPKRYSARGHAFGGGSDGVALEENKKQTKATKRVIRKNS